MKIIDFETIVLNNVAPYRGGRYWLFLKLITDEGIIGLGERPTGGGTKLAAQVSLFQDLCEEYVIGANPFDVELLWQRIFAARHDHRHPSLLLTPAISAIEMACWDLIGKAVNQPIYNLLGGRFHEKLRAYAYMPFEGVWENPARAGEVAAQLVAAGNSACKFDPFTPLFPQPRDFSLKTIRRVADIFKSIRAAVGDELEIGLGTHGQLTTAVAIRVAHILEEYHPFWFEEPVPPENVDEMARVAAHTSIPIATGERLVTKFEFAEVLNKQAAQILQLDLGQCGGLLESKKIAGMAEAHYAMIAPHMYCGPISAAAAVQLDTCSPNFLIQEFNTGPLHSEIFEEPIRFENGFITPPTGPGLGVTLNEAVVNRQRVA
ncbi:MAG TPA: mandelate racemase/muconate lactonizing enzyme family protein [Caldilineaceae bacterium]|nr:mandelate racemase/muconate lactonizing enzyme family protein [Caldilineaceae bacterium]